MGGKRVSAAAIILVVMTSGCGGTSEADAKASAKASASASASAAAQERERNRKERQAEALEQCADETDSLLRTLKQIDSRLGIGLDAGQLSDYLGDAQVAYDGIDFGEMSEACSLKVGIALEDGLNQYIDSLNNWNDCIEDFSCEVEGAVLRRMRKHWSEAKERLEYAEKQLSNPAAFAGGPDGITD